MSPFKQAARKLYEAGYSILPIAPNSKKPFEEGWSKYCDDRASVSQVKSWMKQDDLNIGVTLGSASGIIALDFDVNVNGLHERIEKLIPNSPVRKVGYRGYTVFFKYEGQLNRKWLKGRETVIELLSTGRQTVMPPSNHPLGGVYVYESDEELGDVDVSALPSLPQDFCEQLDKLFEVAATEGTLEVSLTDIIDALEFIDPDPYDDWIKVGMAIKSAIPEDGFEIWDTWSQRSSKYREEEMLKRWRSFRRDGVSISTLFYMAIKNGFTCRFTETELRSSVMQSFVTLDQVEDKIDLWKAEGKYIGIKAGVPGLDEMIHFRRGEFYLFTGYANQGKSEMVDSVVMGLIKGDERWKFALCSMEKTIQSHYDNLIHKTTGKHRSVVDTDDYRKAKALLRDQVIMIDYNTIGYDIDNILDQVEKYMKFNTLDALVIDPFNYLRSNAQNDSDLRHVRHVAVTLPNFAKKHNIAVMLVAHPTKPDKTFGEKLPRLTQYSISGGADFANAADNVIAVYRRQGDSAEVEVLKVRDQEVDTTGSKLLQFDKTTRNYTLIGSDDDI